MKKVVICALILCCLIHPVRWSVDVKKHMFPYDFPDVFPFDFEEQNRLMVEYDQIYTGLNLLSPAELICGVIEVKDQQVYYGAVCHFLSVRSGDEWIIAGWVKYSNDERYVYVKRQSYFDGYYHCHVVVPQFGDSIGIHLYHWGDPNIWTVNVWRNSELVINQKVNFLNAPNMFMAYTKSLWRQNRAYGEFDCLEWMDTNFEFHLWKDVQIREEQPYKVRIIERNWHFIVETNNYMRWDFPNCYACTY